MIYLFKLATASIAGVRLKISSLPATPSMSLLATTRSSWASLWSALKCSSNILSCRL